MVARWSVGPRDEQDWGGSRWIAHDVLLENTQEKMPGAPGLPPEPNFIAAPYLRKEFDVCGPVRSAFIYACGLGYAELYLNGHKLGDGIERDPGFTNYERRVLYVTHDVSHLIGAGRNALGAILGTGWYDVHDVATWHFNTAPWRQRPRLRLTLVLQYESGAPSFIVSDESWKCGTGPILRDGIYTGEIYDARLELPVWSEPGFAAVAWTPALVVDPPHGKLVPLSCEPIRITDTITPVAITQPQPGVYIVDMGQNFSGHAQLRVKGPSGHAITMRYAEILHPDGTLNASPIDHLMMQSNPRQPFQQDTYICKGSGEEEVWEQRFSYSGFQYVEVTNFPGTPTLDNFRGRFAHTDLKPAGEFVCSNDIANRIQHATLWSYLSNAQSYPTDCPQREKNGWTGDAGLAVECGLMNFQSAAFYGKWLEDFADAQRPDDGFPVLIPNGGWGNGESWPGELTPPWDAAYPLIVWNLYRYTGDQRVLGRHVQPLRRYVDFFLRHRKGNGMVPGLGIGDWVPWHTETPLDYISNAYLCMDVDLLTQVLGAIGETQAQQHYRGIRQEVAAAFQKAFYDPATHQYANGSQTAQSTALYFGLVPDSEKDGVFAELVRNVEQQGHLDVGILGAKHLLRALSQGGRTDLAFHIATQQEMPGWGYWMKVGATTLWEGWKAGPSYNHIMFGDVSAWLYQWIAGIQQESASVGFREIVFRPNPVDGLTSAAASYLTPRGKVSAKWAMEDHRLRMTFDVPCGASARLVLPKGVRFCKSSLAERKLKSGHQEIDAVLT
jgi:alpha-L-rhamnosidase